MILVEMDVFVNDLIRGNRIFVTITMTLTPNTDARVEDGLMDYIKEIKI